MKLNNPTIIDYADPVDNKCHVKAGVARAP